MDLAMVPDGGVLSLRDTEEPALLAAPTTLTGSVDEFSGAVSGVTFATAPLSFEFEITDPVEETVYVDAVFSEVTPGSATGSIRKANPEGTLGDVTIDAVVEVDLHVEIGGGGPGDPAQPLIAPQDCTASPIALRLEGRYDTATKEVTLADADFSVAPVPESPSCTGIVADGVNERLAGGGHSISIAMEGDLWVPVVGVEETVTTLVVAPGGGSDLGDEVMLSATVAPAPGAEPGTPGGLVEFRDGDTALGTAAVDGGGAASFATSGLAVGPHELTARYLGDQVYANSDSAAVSHDVAAKPTVAVDMAPTLLLGGFAREARITVANPPEFSSDVENVRVEITISRIGQATAALDPARVQAEWLDGETWEPIALVNTATRVIGGTVGPATGFALPAAASNTIRIRLVAPIVAGSTTSCGNGNATCPGNLQIDADLLEVDPGTGDVVEPIAEATDTFTLVESSRRPINMVFSGGALRPHTVRQGFSTNVAAVSPTQMGGLRPSGLAEVFIDGEQTLVRNVNAVLDETGYVEDTPVNGGAVNAFVLLPPDISPGLHFASLRYKGDAFFAPFEVTTTFTVLPADGHPFVCREEGFITKVEVGANVTFAAQLPAAAAAGEGFDLDISSALVKMNRQSTAGVVSAPFAALADGGTYDVGGDLLTGVSFGLGPDGSGTAASLERQGGSQITTDVPNPGPADETTVDQTITLHGPTASVTVAGEPGDIVPVELTSITLDYILGDINPFPYTMTCTPVGEPLVLGEVEVAGTTLTVDPGGPVRENVDDELSFSAETFPAGAAGTVLFSSDVDGALGSDIVSEGAASLVVDGLSVGDHVVTAAFDATDPDVPDTAGSVSVRVLPEFDCPAFAEEGSAAVVRLVYLELLGRCPDPAGFAFWKGRLDGGTSREAFARTIARTPEAVGRVVDDAYEAMLGRAADPAGRVFWTGRLQASGRYDALLAELAGSGEFWSKAGASDEGFVTRVYERLLGRAPDAGGLEFWTGRLDAGVSRRALVVTLANLDEPLGVLVADAYGEILDRAPTATGRSDGIAFLRATGDRSGFYARLIGTNEFASRADQLPNPED